MPKTVRTRTATIVQARGHLAKADEFAAAASAEFKAERTVKAASLVVHSGINSVDTACEFRLGKRVVGQHHGQVFVLPEQIGRDGMDLGKHLLKPLVMKTKVEYDSDDVPLLAASRAIGRALA